MRARAAPAAGCFTGPVSLTEDDRFGSRAVKLPMGICFRMTSDSRHSCSGFPIRRSGLYCRGRVLRPSNSMLGCRATTPQDYPQSSGFGWRREREWGHRRQRSRGTNQENPPMRTYIIGNDGIALCRKTPAAVNDGEMVVSSKEELLAAPLNGKRLLALWNALPGVEKRRRVGDRAALIEQLWSAIERLPDPEPRGDPKRPSKQDVVIAMLRQPAGATVDEVANVTGWQRHTVRGVFSGSLKKKLGLTLASAKEERGRVYRIAEPASA